LKLIQDLPDFLDKSISVIFAPSRNEHGDHKSCHSGVNSRAEHSDPNAKTKKCVKKRPPDPEEVGDCESQDEKNADHQVAPDDLFGVEESDNDYCPEVIGNGKSRKKDPEADRQLPTEYRNGPQSKGDIGGHGYAPAVCRGSAAIEDKKDGAGEEHPTQGGKNREKSTLGGRKFAHENFSFDLQAHDKNEKGHETVIDPVDKRLGNAEFTKR
jgi:hypothetical protein